MEFPLPPSENTLLSNKIHGLSSLLMFSLKFLFLLSSCYARICFMCHLNPSLSLLFSLQTFALSVTDSARSTNAALVSVCEMQEAAVRSGKMLFLPSLRGTLASFLFDYVFLCSCPSVLEQTRKVYIFFLQSYPTFSTLQM